MGPPEWDQGGPHGWRRGLPLVFILGAPELLRGRRGGLGAASVNAAQGGKPQPVVNFMGNKISKPPESINAWEGNSSGGCRGGSASHFPPFRSPLAPGPPGPWGPMARLRGPTAPSHCWSRWSWDRPGETEARRGGGCSLPAAPRLGGWTETCHRAAESPGASPPCWGPWAGAQPSPHCHLAVTLLSLCHHPAVTRGRR